MTRLQDRGRNDKAVRQVAIRTRRNDKIAGQAGITRLQDMQE
jgi:hypothetical protein